MKPIFLAIAPLLVFANLAIADQTSLAKPPIYNESADARSDVAKAVEKAVRENKRVLLQIGGNWCPWCHKLHELFASDKAIAHELLYEYEVVNVDIAHGEKNRDLLAGYGITAKGYPYLAVIGADNKLVTQQETGALEDGPKHDPKKVLDFLIKWQAPALDAKQVLSKALSQAGGEGKRVLIRFGAPWCGWCHKLDDVLYQPAVDDAIKTELVSIKIDVDRMTNGKEVQTRYQTSGGIPWYAVLDDKGKVLSTSDLSPGKNIGFPTEPAELDHVLKMLTDAHTRMTTEQINTVKEAFTKAAVAVNQARH